MRSYFYYKISLFLIITISATETFAQSGNCDAITPFFSVDLTGSPDSTWYSPNIRRKGECCGETGPPPPRCVEFEITLDPNAVGIIFDIYSGAVPSGAMYYHINCGPAITVGEPICLVGTGPFTLTFCEPGNNPNVYAITSIDGSIEAFDTNTVEGCTIPLRMQGIRTSGITWKDITGGGIYDNNLSCLSNCTNPIFTAPYGISQIQYEVCGIVSANKCDNYAIPVCDTLTITIDTIFDAHINPNIGCVNDNNYLVATTTIPSTYTYKWYNSANGSGQLIGTASSLSISSSGNYSVVVTDTSIGDCAIDTANITIQLKDTSATTYITLNSCNPNEAGTVTQTFTNINNCDSLVSVTTLFVLDTLYLTSSSCNSGDTGLSTQIQTDINGCKSIVYTTTSLLPKSYTYIYDTICNESYVFNGDSLTTSGIYRDTLSNGTFYGCDSIIILELFVFVEICDNG